MLVGGLRRRIQAREVDSRRGIRAAIFVQVHGLPGGTANVSWKGLRLPADEDDSSAGDAVLHDPRGPGALYAVPHHADAQHEARPPCGGLAPLIHARTPALLRTWTFPGSAGLATTLPPLLLLLIVVVATAAAALRFQPNSTCVATLFIP